MWTALDAPADRLDRHQAKVVAIIHEHGWHCTYVFDPDGEQPDFSYSTGFRVNADHPEMIVFGLPSETANEVLWDVFREA